MGTRVLLVGLDGADHALVEQAAAEGALATLARLRRDGVRGALAGLYGLGDDAAWSSFATGVMPSTHGRYYHARFGPDGTTLGPYTRDQMHTPPFWDPLVRAGRQVAVIDVPKSPLGDGRAVVVADWMPHGPDEPRASFSAAARARGLHEVLKPDPTFDCDAVSARAKTTAAFERRLAVRARDRTAVVRGLLDAEDWDLVVTSFAEPHCVGHTCWRDAAVVGRVYRDVDAHLGTLVDAAGPDATVIVFSLTGMGANHSGTHLLPEVLTRLEPEPSRRRLVRRESAPRRFTVLPLDLRTSAIRIAREHSRDDEETRHHLRTLLRELTDPDTGAPLVDDVVFVDEVDPGPAAGDFADVLVEWNSTKPIRAARIDGAGVVRRRPPRDRSGNHRGGGWFVAAGPGLAPASVEHPRAIVDLAPTVAAMFGEPLDGAAGVPIVELAGRV
jgi:predicted AlkP superfamily phosphohydrolase/phosphomutase